MSTPLHVQMIPRCGWGAKEAKMTGPLSLPISYIFLDYTLTSTCQLPETCSKELMYAQERDMKIGRDIRYNFMVNSVGKIFVGRGFVDKPLLPSCYRNIQYTSLLIGLIGTFESSEPTKTMRKGVNALIKYGMDYKLIEEKVLEFNLRGGIQTSFY